MKKITFNGLALAILFFTTLESYSQCAASFTWVENSGIVTFTNTSTGINALGYGTWDFGDGAFGSTSALAGAQHAYSVNGYYLACLTISDSMGCTNTFCDSIFVQNATGSSCYANYSYLGDTCLVTFTDLSSATAGIVLWSWDFGDGNYSTLQNPTHTYSGAGPFYVQLKILDGNGVMDSIWQTISLPLCNSSQPPCSASYFWVHDSTLAYTILLYNTSNTSLSASYFWDFGDGSNSTLPYPSHVYAGVGVYTVCVTVVDSNCTSTYCDSIAVMYKNQTAFSINVVSLATNNLIEYKWEDFIVYPNPFKNELNLEANLSKKMEIGFDLIDLSGRILYTRKTEMVPLGKFTANLRPAEIAAGIYMLRITTGTKISLRKVIVN